MCVTLHICHHQVGHTALMRAAFWGRIKVVAELVKGGADLNLQNKVCQFMYHMYIHYMTHRDAIQDLLILVRHSYQWMQSSV